ncbi:hypothetical protein AB0G87_36750 [Streptomyces asoensis]|uniref:hypothetical protein n=1 Tax=Streptomyces asoensis TaxID=249586 RepID=UPI0033CE953E
MPNGISDPIHRALELAERRAKKRLVGDLRQYVNMDATREKVLGALHSYITEHGGEYNPTFWEVASENVFLAVGIRDAHKEPELSQEEIWNYLDTFAEFINTLKHIP